MIKQALYNMLSNSHRQHALNQLAELEKLLPSPKSRFAVPFVFKGQGHYKKIRPRQNPVEIENLFNEICNLNPKRVLEIGTARGGTLYLWTQAATDDATLVSVDLPGGDFGGAYAGCRTELYRAFTKGKQQLHLFLEDSHDKSTLEKVAARFNNKPIDFAFIDGDHTYEGVKADFNDYGPLVRAGGIIAFHDILYREKQPSIRVNMLWKELQEQYDCTEFIGPEGSGKKIGIGLLRVPDSGVKPI